MSTESANVFVAKCFLTYMLNENYDLPEPSESTYAVRLIDVVMRHWTRLVREIELYAARTVVMALVLRLLDTTRPHFQDWVAAGTYDNGTIPEWIVMPGCEPCLTLAYLCYFEFFETAKQFVENLSEPVPFETEIKLVSSFEDFGGEWSYKRKRIDGVEGKLLHIAASMGNILFAKYFLEKGADINAVSAKGLSVLGSAVSSGWLSRRTPKYQLGVVELLLENGADPNLSNVSVTPLQRIISKLCNSFNENITVAIAIKLLEFRADINKVGDDERNIARTLIFLEDFPVKNHEAERLATILKTS